MKYAWPLSLAISMTLHTAVLVAPAGNSPTSLKDSPSKETQNPETPAEKKPLQMLSPELMEKVSSEKTETVASQPPPFIKNIHDQFLVPDRRGLTFEKPHISARPEKEIILSEVPQDKKLKKLPAYMDYYRMIREKIRKSAYFNYVTGAEGEVIVSFTVHKNGQLGNHFLQDPSLAEPDLERVALKSLAAAAPFPPFPDELTDYTSLFFHISIYFKKN
ncbi:MAG: TonB family protein [Candidatus Omnitrophica bacterium]|nr:TonB family protein [Candidatus Omnitrophota bacterium]